MGSENSLTVSLEEFGLSKYEARAYVTLVSKGTISASELAFYSELPRTKVYPTLLKLEKKKLVILSKSKPIMCTSISPEDAFDEIVQEQINKVNAMNTLVSKLKKVSDESKKSRGAEEKRYFALDANTVLSQLKLMISATKSSIEVIADEWGLILLLECKEQLLTCLRRNVEVRIIVPSSLIGSEIIKQLPDGIKIRVSEIIQNCILFDQIELLLLDNENGKGVCFSSSEILGTNQSELFQNIWRHALKIDSLVDLNKAEAQEIYNLTKVINENALGHVLNITFLSKTSDIDMLKFVEKCGINLSTKSLDELIDIIDSSLQLDGHGKASFNKRSNNITIESRLNSGHSLSWAAILASYLQKNGYKPRIAYQNYSHKGEKIHIKVSP